MIWTVDNLETIGGHRATVLGRPKVIETPEGRAVEFDGVGDALVVEAHPLAGLDRFRIDVTFRPDAGGLTEQRFLHLHTDDRNRILIETRLTDHGTWFLDTFIFSNGVGQTLYAEGSQHPVGRWYRVALEYSDGEMRHYVDGVQEMTARMTFHTVAGGQTSIGCRMNRVYWFKGAIRQIEFAAGRPG